MKNNRIDPNRFWRLTLLRTVAILFFTSSLGVPSIWVEARAAKPQSSAETGPKASGEVSESSLSPVEATPEQLLQMEVIRQSMIGISKDLGVDCTACHDTKNYKREYNLAYKISKEHIRITQLLIDNGFDGQSGRTKATCYMCHRGELAPKVLPTEK